MSITRFAIAVLAVCLTGACSAAPVAGRVVGFGAATTGGSTPCRVSALTQEALEACTSRPGALVTFAAPGTISLSSPVNLAPNLTLQGPIHFEGSEILLQIADVSNVIIRNASFSSLSAGLCAAPSTPVETKHCGVMINIKGRVRNVWIDRNNFTHCGEKCVEIWNDPRAPVDAQGFAPAPDLITISNNTFSNSFFCLGAGISAATPNAQIRPHGERITVIGNTFDRCFRRSMRAASGADVHEIGNLIERWGGESGASCRGMSFGFGPSAVGGGEILLERNTFVPWPNGPCREAVDTSDYHNPVWGVERGRGMVRSVGNRLLGGATATENDPGEVFTPAYGTVPVSAPAP